MRRRQVIEEGSPKVPAYIVTFSDMVTLLLTFFVMLLSLATVQDEELFHKGRESFMRSIKGLGLGMLYGIKARPNFGDIKIRYFINRPDKLFEGRSIDAKEEGIRRVFQRVSRSMRAMPSQIVAKRTNFSVTDIYFSPGEAVLNEPAKRFLTKFCLDLQGSNFAISRRMGIQQGPGSEAVRLYVLGLARDEATEKEQWILSARRAQAVADFLQGILPLESKWPVYSWGAGPGGDWVSQDSPISEQSQILIAVLRANE